MMRVRLPRLEPLAAAALLLAGAVVVLVCALVAGALVGALLETEVGAAAGGAAGAAGLQAAAPTRPSNASVVASREGCTRESSCPDPIKSGPRAKKSRRVIEISRANIHNFGPGAQLAAPEPHGELCLGQR